MQAYHKKQELGIMSNHIMTIISSSLKRCSLKELTIRHVQSTSQLFSQRWSSIGIILCDTTLVVIPSIRVLLLIAVPITPTATVLITNFIERIASDRIRSYLPSLAFARMVVVDAFQFHKSTIIANFCTIFKYPNNSFRAFAAAFVRVTWPE